MLRCESQIDEVMVYARGALVSRRVSVPAALAAGAIELVIDGLTPLLDAGSVRAALVAPGRQAVALQTELVFPPPGGETLGKRAAQVEELAHQRAALNARRERLRAERERWSALALGARLQYRHDQAAVTARLADAGAARALVAAEVTALDAALAALAEELFVVDKQLAAARLDYEQAPSSARVGAAHPEHRVIMRLSGEGDVEGLRLHYTVPAARWWPVHTVRISTSDGGSAVDWLHEAQVAQRSGEDWSRAALTLSTADLIADARLPELAALRLGRAQPPRPQRGYRPPPDGLDALFAGYARHFAPAATPTTIEPMAEPEPELEGALDRLYESADDGADLDEETEAPMVPPPARKAVHKSADTGRFAAPPAMAAAPMPQAMRSRGTALGGAPGGGRAATRRAEPEPTGPPQPSQAWLDFDRLTLGDNDDLGQRGRLSLEARAAGDDGHAVAALEAMPPPRGAVDPRDSRGQFDYAFAVRGRAEVPSDGQPHRVGLGDGRARGVTHYRAVPRADAAVYRELTLENPFAGPLLAGPIDVYVEGSLLLSTTHKGIDRGGKLTLGLGVEERLKVARRVVYREQQAGLLGGSVVTHADVSIDLSSALAQPIRVQVVDRYPISFDDSLEVKLTASQPPARPYDQSERGAPLSHGLAFEVDVPAGGKASVAFGYTLTHSAKSEIIGGNRRD